MDAKAIWTELHKRALNLYHVDFLRQNVAPVVQVPGLEVAHETEAAYVAAWLEEYATNPQEGLGDPQTITAKEKAAMLRRSQWRPSDAALDRATVRVRVARRVEKRMTELGLESSVAKEAEKESMALAQLRAIFEMEIERLKAEETGHE